MGLDPSPDLATNSAGFIASSASSQPHQQHLKRTMGGSSVQAMAASAWPKDGASNEGHSSAGLGDGGGWWYTGQMPTFGPGKAASQIPPFLLAWGRRKWPFAVPNVPSRLLYGKLAAAKPKTLSSSNESFWATGVTFLSPNGPSKMTSPNGKRSESFFT